MKYSEAILEAIDLSMEADERVYVMGLGVPDPKGVFGTTLGLAGKYGDQRVLDMPASENCMTGVAIGSALVGMRPILSHQRVDFALLAMEQMVNQAAKWHYMFDGQADIPLVIRMIVGRGWGQGPQHSQHLHALFAHIPGLKVVMPTTPADAKGLLISSIEDSNPVVFIEHRWLHQIEGSVPGGMHRVPLGKARVFREGDAITVVALSYMTLEAARAAEVLEEEGIWVEVLDVRSVRPLDTDAIVESVKKTGALVVADTGWTFSGFAAEIISQVVECALPFLKAPPERVALPDCPTPTSRELARHYYPRANQIAASVRRALGVQQKSEGSLPEGPELPDVPDKSFTGPF